MNNLYKIIGIIALIILFAASGFVLVLNMDILLLPKDSITIKVVDEKNREIDGLVIKLKGPDTYTEEFKNKKSITFTDVKAGEYQVIFAKIPSSYACPMEVNSFTLQQGGKVKMEYECMKQE